MYSCSIPQNLRASQIEMCVMESNAFMKSIIATHILTPHSWHLQSAAVASCCLNTRWEDFFFNLSIDTFS